MTNRSRIALTVLLGAVGGGVCGYLFLTERGSEIRADLEPRLKDVIAEMKRLRATVEDVVATASEGWESIGNLVAAERAPEISADETRH